MMELNELNTNGDYIEFDNPIGRQANSTIYSDERLGLGGSESETRVHN